MLKLEIEGEKICHTNAHDEAKTSDSTPTIIIYPKRYKIAKLDPIHKLLLLDENLRENFFRGHRTMVINPVLSYYGQGKENMSHGSNLPTAEELVMEVCRC